MGAWGPKLYQDDIAEDVRDYYKDQLHRGKTGVEITQELIYQNEDVLSDPDDAPVFWFALADTQWNFGRLEDVVKEKALIHIQEGYDLLRWRMENPKNAKAREKAIEELRHKLLSPQPPEKKVSQYKLYQCQWKNGDVYAYRLKGDYAKENGVEDKYLYFVKVDESTWYPGHIVPVVYFYWITSDKLLNLEELKKAKYIPQFFVQNVYEKEPQRKKLYLLKLLSTSSRVIPNKQLTFVGNLQDVKRVENEDLNSYTVSWKDLERYIIDDFRNWTK